MTAHWDRSKVLAVVSAALDGDREVYVSRSGHVQAPLRSSLIASRGGVAAPPGYRLWADVPEIRAALAEMGFHPERGIAGLRIELGKRSFRHKKEIEHARLKLGTMVDSADTEERVAKERARKRLSDLLADADPRPNRAKRRRKGRKAVVASAGTASEINPPNAWNWTDVARRVEPRRRQEGMAQRSRKSKRDMKPGGRR